MANQRVNRRTGRPDPDPDPVAGPKPALGRTADGEEATDLDAVASTAPDLDMSDVLAEPPVVPDLLDQGEMLRESMALLRERQQLRDAVSRLAHAVLEPCATPDERRAKNRTVRGALQTLSDLVAPE